MEKEKLLRTLEEILPCLSDTGIDRFLYFAEGLAFALSTVAADGGKMQEQE